MSTSPNLPAGAAITSINGVRCTAVPRSITTVSSTKSSSKSTSTTSTSTSSSLSSSSSSSSSSISTTSISTSTTPTQEATSKSTTTTRASDTAAIVVGGPVVVTSSTSTGTTSSSSSSIIAISTLATPPPPPPPIAPVPITISSTSAEPQTTSTDSNSATTSASPASKGTTPTDSSSTSLAIAQSEFSASPSATTHDPETHLPDASHASTAGVAVAPHSTSSGEYSPSSGISSKHHLTTGPIIGGVLGGISFLALIALLIWFLRRRQKLKRVSLLTPLTTGTREKFYEIDAESVGPTPKGQKIIAQLGGAVARMGAGITGVGAAFKSHPNAKNDSRSGLNFGIPEDPFADPAPRSAGPWKPPNKGANLNSNPFADPIPRPNPAMPRSNAYIREIRRSRGQSIDSTRMGNNQRSAYGPAAYRTPNIGVVSRYPSSMAPSTDSYRDTVYSTVSSNPRKIAGRSDPFDLERPELWLSSSS